MHIQENKMIVKKKMVTIKVEQRDVDLILSCCNDMKWGISSMFEYGSMSVAELHRIDDMFRNIKSLLNIEDDGVYPNNYYRSGTK